MKLTLKIERLFFTCLYMCLLFTFKNRIVKLFMKCFVIKERLLDFELGFSSTNDLWY